MQEDTRTVMIVDDDADLSMLIIDMLEDNGFKTIYVTSLDEAYRTLEKQKPHLIILDINLPDGTGFELCQELRRVSDVPVIFASARTSEDDKVQGLDIGGDDYIAKPYSLKELMSRIHSLLRRTYGNVSKAETITINAGTNNMIRIDKASRSVYRNEKQVPLSPKEYELLCYMAENKNILQTKEHLLNTIWGAFSEVEQSTLTVHIRWLREKLELDSSKPVMIKTVWGTGYILEEL